jgi:WD40 repeat protein
LGIYFTTDCKRAITYTTVDNTYEFIQWELSTAKSFRLSIKDNFFCIPPTGKIEIVNFRDKTNNRSYNFDKERIKKIGRNICYITNDGNRVIFDNEETLHSLTLWDLTKSKIVAELDGYPFNIESISIALDGKVAITRSEKTIIIWDLVNGLKIHELSGHSSSINCITITPDGKRIISSSDDKLCIIWDVITGQKFKTLQGHTHNVNVIAITPDGKFAISGSRDGKCICWDLTIGVLLYILNIHEGSVNTISITLDGTKVISSSGNQCLLWDIKTGKIMGCYISTSSIELSKAIDDKIVLGCFNGDIIILNVDRKSLCPNLPVSTIFQIWNFELQKYLNPTADCPLCGKRFEPPDPITETILQILRQARITTVQSPCLELPDESWEHPGLFGECPSCHEPLKFNPFFGSDQKGIEDYLLELEKDSEWETVFENAENAFKGERWEEAFKLYLKLISLEKFDASYMRYNMALCRINTLTTNNHEIIGNINVLIRLLQEKGEHERVRTIEEKFKERLDLIKEAEKPWWKKLF